MDPVVLVSAAIAVLLLGGLVVVDLRKTKQNEAAIALANRNKTPEQLRSERIDRETREREAAKQNFAESRARASGWFQILGVVLIVISLWFLIVDPGSSSVGDSPVINLQKLFVGETAAIVGSIFLSAGVLLKYLT